MSNAARKARKRAGVKFERIEKKPTMRYGDDREKGLGLMSSPELMARMLAAGRSMWESRSFR